MHFSGVTLVFVSPINPELTDISVQSLFTTITSGAGASDLAIKFGPLVTFFILIYSLSNLILQQIGATTFSFDFFLSLDGALYFTRSLILKRFNLV